MGLFDFLKGNKSGDASGDSQQGDAVVHEGYTIVPRPKSEGGQFYVGGVISKGEGDDARTHEFIRADTHGDFESACDHSIIKAKQIIKEQGERMFR